MNKFILLLLFSCFTQITFSQTTYWWNDQVFYEIFVRSYYDNNNDGIGDFKGLVKKLGYLNDLGITAVWLMPIMQSPSYHGYDVIDYRKIEQDYGTNLGSAILKAELVTGVDDKYNPETFTLEQNYPNPFNPSTRIDFTLPQSGEVKLSVINILGQEVKTMVNEKMTSGYHTVEFNAADLPSGVYIYKLQSGSYTAARKMILQK